MRDYVVGHLDVRSVDSLAKDDLVHAGLEIQDRVVPAVAVEHERVAVLATRQDVVSGAADHHVVPALGEQTVMAVISVQPIIADAAEHDVRPGAREQHVVARITGQQVLAVGAGDHIVAIAAEEQVVARIRCDDVIAATREQNIRIGTPSERLTVIDPGQDEAAVITHATDKAGIVILVRRIAVGVAVGRGRIVTGQVACAGFSLFAFITGGRAGPLTILDISTGACCSGRSRARVGRGRVRRCSCEFRVVCRGSVSRVCRSNASGVCCRDASGVSRGGSASGIGTGREGDSRRFVGSADRHREAVRIRPARDLIAESRNRGGIRGDVARCQALSGAIGRFRFRRARTLPSLPHPARYRLASGFGWRCWTVRFRSHPR